jgi:hypothetical protein
MITEECKKDIIEYLYNNGWGTHIPVFWDYRSCEISRSYFLDSKKGISKQLNKNHFSLDKWASFDKYLLEYIGPILRKHNIIHFTIWDNYQYGSQTWKFDDIKHLNSGAT